MWKCAIYQGFGTRNGLGQDLGFRGLGFRVTEEEFHGPFFAFSFAFLLETFRPARL